MQESTTREKILKKIRQALIHHNPQPYPNIDWDKNVYARPDESLEEMFAHAFTQLGGQFVFCVNELEFLESILHLAEERSWKNFFCYEKQITQMMDEAEFPISRRRKILKKEWSASLHANHWLPALAALSFPRSRLQAGG
jgi:L-lactate dehydrogenase complex protein LldG